MQHDAKGVRNEPRRQRDNPLPLCVSERRLHTARHQHGVWGVTTPLNALAPGDVMATTAGGLGGPAAFGAPPPSERPRVGPRRAVAGTPTPRGPCRRAAHHDREGLGPARRPTARSRGSLTSRNRRRGAHGHNCAAAAIDHTQGHRREPATNVRPPPPPPPPAHTCDTLANAYCHLETFVAGSVVM